MLIDPVTSSLRGTTTGAASHGSALSEFEALAAVAARFAGHGELRPGAALALYVNAVTLALACWDSVLHGTSTLDELLPDAARDASAGWRWSFVDRLVTVAEQLVRGCVPRAECIADHVALHLVCCDAALDVGLEMLVVGGAPAPPYLAFAGDSQAPDIAGARRKLVDDAVVGDCYGAAAGTPVEHWFALR